MEGSNKASRCLEIDMLYNPEKRDGGWPSGERERHEQREASGKWVGGLVSRKQG